MTLQYHDHYKPETDRYYFLSCNQTNDRHKIEYLNISLNDAGPR